MCVAIVAVVAIIAGSTYAYWQITKTQKGLNDMVAACLDITMQNETGTFGLDKAWPISDAEGEALTGYTFEVKNNCDENVNYIVGLNSVTGSSDNYLAYSSLRLKLDDNLSSLISEFGDIGYSDPENTEIVRDSKLLSMESLEGKGIATHNVKVWIDKDAPVTEQNKIFRGQIFITGGQGVPIYDDCFAINTDGTILSYDYSCGYNVEIPATIAEIEVKTINQASFAMSNVQGYSVYNEETDEGKEIYYYTDESTADDFINFAKQSFCEDPTTCTLEDIEAMGLKIITTEEEYNAIDWEGYEESGYTIDGPYTGYFNLETGEIDEAASPIKSLDLSETVYLEAIGESAFESSDTLENLVLPENGVLTTIGEYAFAETSLTEITIPNTVETIGAYAFQGSTDGNQIAALTFEASEENPSKLTTIGNGAFRDNSLTGITIPDSVTSIGSSAFYGNQITEVSVNAKTIGYSAFSYNKLTNVTIGSAVETIEDYAFQKNSSNDTLNVNLIFEDSESNPSKLTSIGRYAFYGNQIRELKLPSSLVILSDYSFYSNGIENVTIPNTITTIGDSALANNNLTAIELSDNLITIGSNAFNNNRISDLIIPATVETIGGNAFSNNEISTLIYENTEENPSKLNSVGTKAFSNNKLTEAYFLVQDMVDNKVYSDNVLTKLVFSSYITSLENAYFGGSYDKKGTIREVVFEDTEDSPSQLTAIGGSTFSYNEITSLILPKSLKTIGSWTFSNNCITELIIPSSVTSIGSHAFGYNQISSLVFEDTEENPSQLTSIGEYAFSGNSITVFIAPSAVSSIGNNAFSSNRLEKVKISSSVQTIEDDAFQGSESGNQITSLTFENTTEKPSKLTTIGKRAFHGNAIAGTITIPSSVTSIGYSSFDYNKISNLVFENTEENPSKLQYIGQYAFHSNELTGTLTIPSSVQIIEDDAFGAVSSAGNQITELIFENTEENPSQLKTIGQDAFFRNAITGTVTIPSSVQTIENTAFEDNDITTLIFEDTPEKPSNLKTIYVRAFYGNAITGTLTIPSSVETLDYRVFEENKITSLVIKDTFDSPSKLKRIGWNAFYDNTITGIVTIPGSVTYIGENAFNSNKNITQIVVKNTEENVSQLNWNSKWNVIGWSFTTNSSVYAPVTYDPNYTE